MVAALSVAVGYLALLSAVVVRCWYIEVITCKTAEAERDTLRERVATLEQSLIRSRCVVPRIVPNDTFWHAVVARA